MEKAIDFNIQKGIKLPKQILDKLLHVRDLAEEFVFLTEVKDSSFYKHSSLSGFCAIASSFLYTQLLDQYKMISVCAGHFDLHKFHCGNFVNHSWLEVILPRFKTPIIIDLTISQFLVGQDEYSRILISKSDDPRYDIKYKFDEYYNAEMYFKCWAKCQSPNRYLKKFEKFCKNKIK